MADDLGQQYLERRSRTKQSDFLDWMGRMSSQWEQEQQADPVLRIQQQIMQIAPEYGLDPSFVTAITQAESGFNPRAVSQKGAQGLMQLMPATARQYKVGDPFDVEENLRGGMRFLRDLQKRYPNRPDLQAAAYNAGPGAVDTYGGIPPYPETQQYVQKVLGKGAATPGGAGPTRASVDAEVQAMGKKLDDPRMLGPSAQPAGTLPVGGRPELPLTQAAPATGPLAPYLASVQRLPESITGGIIRSMENILAAPEAFGLVEEAGGAGRALQTARSTLATLRQGVAPTPGDPTWIDKFGQAAGSMAFSVVPGLGVQALTARAVGFMGAYAKAAGWAGSFASAAIESTQEMGDVYDTLKTLVGTEEAQTRAQSIFGKNLVLLTLTNRLGINADFGRGVLRFLAGGTMESAQEWLQYDISQKQFWMPTTAPMAERVRTLGWKEEGDRLVAPVSIKDQAQAAAFGMVLGGGAAVATGRALEQAPASLPEIFRTALEEDTGRAEQVLPQTAVREGYGTEEPGRLKRVYHGTPKVVQQLDPTHSTETQFGTKGSWFAEDPDIAGGRSARRGSRPSRAPHGYGHAPRRTQEPPRGHGNRRGAVAGRRLDCRRDRSPPGDSRKRVGRPPGRHLRSTYRSGTVGQYPRRLCLKRPAI